MCNACAFLWQEVRATPNAESGPSGTNSERALFCPHPKEPPRPPPRPALILTEEVEGRQGTGQDILQTLQPFSLFLLTGAGEDEFPLWSDDSESNLPAIPSDAPGQVFAHLITLLFASQENLALLESVLKMEGSGYPALPGPRSNSAKRCAHRCQV